MKKYFILGLFLFSIYSFAQGQNSTNHRQEDFRQEDRTLREPQMVLDKTPFIAQRLELSPELNKSFLSLYTEFSNAMEAIKKRGNLVKKSGDTLSDKEIQKILNDRMLIKRKEIKILKKYEGKFRAILPLAKVYQLHLIEDEYESQRMKRPSEVRNQKGDKEKQ